MKPATPSTLRSRTPAEDGADEIEIEKRLSAGNGNIIIKNTARGNVTDFSFLADSIGPTQSVPANSGTLTITNLSPWANFAY